MPFNQATKNTSVASRAAAYSIPGVVVDGNNVLDVYAKAGEAVERARRGAGPTLLECLTYRWFGHHEGDAGTSYRTKEEIADWRKKDPVERLKSECISSSVLSAEDFTNVDQEVQKLIDEAAAVAIRSPQPHVDTALDHVIFS
jgi:pyruvate dehydrogenase E1 component alpha subunit